MVTPGLYRHYKGPLYRVLFVAECRGIDKLEADEVLRVGDADGQYTEIVKEQLWHRELNFSHLLDARWSGNTTRVAAGPVVIYVALYDTGRVAARPLDEFEEHIDGVPRFERIDD
jgi:hypothetical protein